MLPENAVIAELRGISKQYAGSFEKANDDITLDLRKGEILCVAGENGAGKTTLMKILCGLEKPDSGEIFINGRSENISSPLAAKNLGIGMMHQHFMLFPEYTVAENVVMGVEPRKWGIFFDFKKAKDITDKIIEHHGFSIKSTQKVKDLTLGQMQQAEICRILHSNAQIIILDEPASILTEQETASLFKTLKNLVSEGKSIILITHKLNEIKNNCDRIAVLRRGKITGIREAANTNENEIALMMMGEELSVFDIKRTNIETEKSQIQNKEPVIEFRDVTVKRRGQKRFLLDKISFSVNSGEILGFAGVGGNGLGIIEAVLGGFLHPAEGRVFHKGKDISSFSIRKLRKEGLAYVPADRVRFGSAGEAAIEENMIINRRYDFVNGIILNKKKIRKFTEELAENYKISGARTGGKCDSLSGGNLQKLILAREINGLKDYIVFSEPSWGLDIASSRFIMSEIVKLRDKGAAVILISTNLDEIISLSDRIIVMYRGRAAGEFVNAGDLSIKEKIGKCMQGITGAGE